MMAFPSRCTKGADPFFLRPMNAENFARPHVLFRVDSTVHEHEPRRVILVLSDQEPDWQYAFCNTSILAMAQHKPYDPCHTAGSRLRFRIQVNPSIKSTPSRPR